MTDSLQNVRVPPEFWDDIKSKDIREICRNTLSTPSEKGIFTSFVNRELLVDPAGKTIYYTDGQKADNLIVLITLNYLLQAGNSPFRNEMAAPHELKEGHFFKGPHELSTKKLVKRFGKDPEGFLSAGKKLGGAVLDMADAAFRIMAFPKIPVYYLLWKQDDEFAAGISILFDRSIEDNLCADAIWGMVDRVSDLIIENG